MLKRVTLLITVVMGKVPLVMVITIVRTIAGKSSITIEKFTMMTPYHKIVLIRNHVRIQTFAIGGHGKALTAIHRVN